ncbi:MAG: hypothetical protein CMJ20_11860 [Phycisphaeraceae bacterium]|nr:hypothetical protein [Phycisphaeraceae bacterium]
MCNNNSPIEMIRLSRCGHGTFHLNVGPVILHLSDRELVMIDRAIHKWADQHPQWFLDRAIDPPEYEIGEY